MYLRIGCGLMLSVCCAAAHAQAFPRTQEGHPDFQGVWESLWLTPLERPAGVPQDVPEADLERVRQVFLDREANRAKIQLETEGEFAVATKVLRVGGVYRGSQVIDPPDGRIPRTAEGKAKRTDAGNADGPESYNRAVRCIAGVGVPPMITGNFDTLRRIVQTPGHVVVYSESINDTRILPVAAGVPESAPRSLMGASAVRWEADTLVVETSRFDGARPIGIGPFAVPLSDDAVIVERFHLNGPDELVFRYTVTDPVNYTAPWTGEMAWTRSSDRLYETVCHEANYSLANMLRGARIEEERRAKAKPAAK